MHTRTLCLSVLCAVLIYKLCTNSFSYWKMVQTFRLKSNTELESLSSVVTFDTLSPNVPMDKKSECTNSPNRYFNEHYQACLQKCEEGFVFDPMTNTCSCPTDHSLRNGICEPLCNPSKTTFELKNLKYYDDITETCRNVFDVDPRCNSERPFWDGNKCTDKTIKSMPNMHLLPTSYTTLGDGDPRTCLETSECDAVIDTKMIKLKHDALRFKPAERQRLSFKLST